LPQSSLERQRLDGKDSDVKDCGTRQDRQALTERDLIVILGLWTHTKRWSKWLDKALPFREYIHQHAEGAK
jgi:hypothetical protein